MSDLNLTDTRSELGGQGDCKSERSAAVEPLITEEGDNTKVGPEVTADVEVHVPRDADCTSFGVGDVITTNDVTVDVGEEGEKCAMLKQDD